MRKIAFIILPLFFALYSFAQSGTLTGKLTDEKGAPLRFGNVSLLKTKKGDPFALRTLSDSLGAYRLATPTAGTYFIQFTAIGFSKTETDSFSIAGPDVSKDFGTTTMKMDAKNMDNVNITTLRPAIIQRADRLEINVEGTAMAAGNTAFGVLSKAPGVFVDHEGNIQLNGKAGVTVMIDGRLTYLSARDLRNLLETMPAENLKRLEIITNPSAKYDAEGASGMINIVLKKNTIQGINGSVNASYNYNFKQHGYSAGTNINLKLGNWNSFAFIDFNNRVGGREATFTRIFYGQNKTTYFDQVATGNFRNVGPPSVRVGTDYDINAKHTIGGLVYFVTNTGRSDFLTDTYIGNAPKKPAQYIDADNYNKNTYKNFTTNLHYTFKLDTAGTLLTSDLDYARITNKGEGNYYNSFTDVGTGDETIDNLYTFTPNGYTVRSGKIDFTRPFNKDSKLEMGVKASKVESDNDSRFYFNNSGLVLDPQRTNHFFYRENIYAAYVNWNKNLSQKFSVQMGLRAEQTKSMGQSYTTGQVTNRSYLDWFPSVFVQQKVSENYGINYNYSRRLARPNYGSLNPFRAYRDPYTWTVGNPTLRPSYTQSINITQTFRKLYILQFYYQYTKDVMAEIPILDVANAVTVYTTGNVDDGQNIGASTIVPVKLLKFWDTRNTVQLSHSRFTTVSNVGKVENKQLFWSAQSVHTILLPKDFRVELSFLFRGPAASGLYHMEAMNWVDVAVKKSFLQKKLDLSMTISDIFKGYRYLWTTNIGGNVNEFNQYFRFRSLGVSLRYNFSKGQKTNTKQRTGPEELNRL
ncbi:MAG: TonB-dependent receptor [Chitinophagaceae bacterium]|nr:MAG: TonB-dependent receptor [Chitinophagaceae bacterium]